MQVIIRVLWVKGIQVQRLKLVRRLKDCQNFKSNWKLFKITEDAGEKNDLSAKYPEKLKQMIAETEKWSKSHVAPLWYNSEKEAQIWAEGLMPNYTEAFKVK